MNEMNESAPDQVLFPRLDSLEMLLWPALALVVFVATAVIVDVMIILATRFRLVDLPNRRSAHALPTARGGGTAIVFATVAASLVAVYRWPDLSGRILLGMLVPSLVIAVVGLVDDIRPLRPLVRLFIQIAVAAVMTAVLGPLVGIAIPGLPQVDLGPLAWPLTVIWIVGMINAFNFMDGADGMAGLGAVVAGLGIAAIAYQSQALGPMLIAAFAAAATGGFLVFNWQPARVFMGDVGSGFLGAVLAGIPLLVRDSAQPLTFLPMVMCLWPYIYDPFLSVLRRLANGANPLEPHREFLFHRLVRSGVSHSRVALLYGAMSFAGGLLGLMMVSNAVPEDLRRWLPLGVLALAAGLTIAIERRCSRVGLDTAAQPVPAP
jgi:UDP-N-acetylmuramyl pentapeptide phosphotransferase/UDP-N-acetylglucosamine-1-phosphate transferase